MEFELDSSLEIEATHRATSRTSHPVKEAERRRTKRSMKGVDGFELHPSVIPPTPTFLAAGDAEVKTLPTPPEGLSGNPRASRLSCLIRIVVRQN